MIETISVFVIIIASFIIIYYFAIPPYWRIMTRGIIKLLTLLGELHLHNLNCKYFSVNYNFIDEFESQVVKRPDFVQIVAVEDGREITLRELDSLANQVGHWVSDLGFVTGDTIALMMNNRWEFASFWLGVGKAGCSTALLNINSTGRTLSHAVSIALAATSRRILVVDIDIHASLPPTDLDQLRADGTEVIIWENIYKSSIMHAPMSAVPVSRRVAVKEKDPLLFIFTSGTTGLPKASRMSHSRMRASSLPFGIMCELGSHSRVYNCLPLYHASGGAMGVSACLRYGACMVLRRKFSASKFSEDCVRYRCNVFQYVGELCRYLHNASPNEWDSKVRLDWVIGNGLTAEVWEGFQQRYGVRQVLEFYLSTEGNVGIFNCFDKVGSLGFVPRPFDILYPTFVLKPDPEDENTPLRSPDGRCIPAGVGEPGLLVSAIGDRVDRRFDGYTDSMATNKKVLRDVWVEGDRYFNTGDLVSRDTLGFFFWCDRAGDTYRWKGENVSTAEVGVVVGALPCVKDVAVYGVRVPGCEGKAGMMCLVPNPQNSTDTEPNSELDWAAITEAMTQNLTPSSRPIFVRVPADGQIPATATFKHLKAQLANQGFDPMQCRADQLFVWDPRQSPPGFVTLTQELYQDIIQGLFRL